MNSICTEYLPKPGKWHLTKSLKETSPQWRIVRTVFFEVSNRIRFPNKDLLFGTKRETNQTTGLKVIKETKPSLFIDDTIIYMENPSDFADRYLELIRTFGSG